MATFKLAKKDAVSDTRTNIFDLHEKKLDYFETEKKKLPEYLQQLKKLKKCVPKDIDDKNKINSQINLLEEKINGISDDNDLNNYLLDFFVTINSNEEQQFEEQKNKGQMDSFCNSTVNNSKLETYNNYIRKFNPELKEIALNNNDKIKCKNCSSDDFMFDCRASSDVCTYCGLTKETLINDDIFPVFSYFMDTSVLTFII
jgi:hypothetical protein